VPLPSLSPEERAAALEKAAEIRKARAELKERLKQGRTTLAEVLDRAESDDIVGKLKVSAVLQAMPGIGRIRATQIMEKLKIADSRRLRALSEQQREALLGEFAYSRAGGTHSSRVESSVAATPLRSHRSPTGPESSSWTDMQLASSGYHLSAVEGAAGRLTVVLAMPAARLQSAIDRDSPLLDPHTQLTQIGVDVYLATDDATTAERVFSAVDELVIALGYGEPLNVEIQRGSLFRRSKAAARRVLSSDELTSRLKKVERAIELASLDVRQAEVDSVEAQAVTRLIEALKEIPHACIRAGSVFVVKYEGSHGPVILARNLSPLEVHTLESFPEIQTNPRTALEALATAIASRDATQSPRRATG